jgi:hypothetical protein
LEVTGQAGTDEPVDAGAVVIAAMSDQQGRSVVVARSHGTAHR